MSESGVIRLKPNYFIHVLDNNTNVTRCIIGPTTFTRQEHEKVLFPPRPCVNVPPRHFCRIMNPVVKNSEGEPEIGPSGQVKLRLSNEEIRFEQEPFPLYPGECLVETRGNTILPLRVIQKNSALRLRAIRDFVDSSGISRKAGDEWAFDGPGTYLPRVEVEERELIHAQIIKANEALKLRARNSFVDKSGVARVVGEEWLVTPPQEGRSREYLPHVEEVVVEKVQALVLTDRTAYHLECVVTSKDSLGRSRLAGDRWLLTVADAPTYIPGVYEQIIKNVNIITLSNRQYCIISNPIDPNTSLPRYGQREVRKGELSFFLHPGEILLQHVRVPGETAKAIQDVVVIGNEEALLLQTAEEFLDRSVTPPILRQPGTKWLVHGPCDYVPDVQVELLEIRKLIALDENEGVYVRDEETGKVRSVIGTSFLLQANEVLWEKELPPLCEVLLLQPGGTFITTGKNTLPPASRGTSRDKTKVVRFNVQHNAAVQLFDFKTKTNRIVFGPDVIMLQPDELFTILSLSGDTPKVPNVVKAIQLLLGPQFMTDVVIVETSDHARLSLQLSYNWIFQVDHAAQQKVFGVPDFVGDCCNTLASRVRGAVAAETFDTFHVNSAKIIRAAIFGIDEQQKIKDKFVFPTNGLAITNVDIQSVEPVDQKTKDSLQKSVQLAIEITTKSQEAAARHEAARREQAAKSQLERQVIGDKAAAEASRKGYLELQAEAEAIESTGTAKAEAKARAEASLIECKNELRVAELRAKASEIKSNAELEQKRKRQQLELDRKKRTIELEITKAQKLAEIEAQKFADTVDAIGPDTIASIASAGPEMQAKLLGGLGLKGYLITDGSSPINLFNTARGMVTSNMPSSA